MNSLSARPGGDQPRSHRGRLEQGRGTIQEVTPRQRSTCPGNGPAATRKGLPDLKVRCGLTAWDNQKLKKMATVTGPMQENVAVIGALALYLDFLNLFLFLLRLFGDRRR